MDSVGVFEAKNHLSELIERVQRGETVTITKHGKPVAQIVPPAQKPAGLSAEEKARRMKWLEEILAQKEAYRAAGGKMRGPDSAAQLVREGREERTERILNPTMSRAKK